MANKEQDMKIKSIKLALKHLEKTLKKDNVAYIYGERKPENIPVFPSSVLSLDIALGVGGLPKGRVIEFFGAESSGKTLLATKAAGECQKQGGFVAFVDMEHTFDPQFASKLGLDCSKNFILSQPDHLQDAFIVMDALIDAGVDLIILDSVAALVPKEELEGEVGKQTIGLVARYMSQFLRRITGKASKNESTIIFINQIRDAVGVMFGNPVTTPGGKALRFYSSVRVEISKVGGSYVKAKIGGEETNIAHRIRAKIVKNKVGAPFRKAEFMIYYDGRKSDTIMELAEIIVSKGLIPKYDSSGNLSPTGRTFKYEYEGETLIAKKKDDIANELRKCPKIQEKFIDMLKNGYDDSEVFTQDKLDADMTEEEFEASLNEDIERLAEEEEIIGDEDGWDNIK